MHRQLHMSARSHKCAGRYCNQHESALVDVKTCWIDAWMGSIETWVASSSHYKIRTIMCIMQVDQPNDIQLMRADPLCDADVLVVNGSRTEHADSDRVKVAMLTHDCQHRCLMCQRIALPRNS